MIKWPRFRTRGQLLASGRRLSSSTHDVFNQPRPFEDVDLYLSDKALQRGLVAFSSPGEGDRERLAHLGKVYGSAEVMRWADVAEMNKPTLRQFDKTGRRIDVIDYVDKYHALMKLTIEEGALLMANQCEPGHCCPVTMTSAAVPILQQAAKQHGCHPYVPLLLDKVLSQRYDSANLPIKEKKGATIGMSMTEKQGGSDVRANTTSAILGSRGDGSYVLRGHKWFTSAAMSDAFLTLAKIESDALPSCFLVPRWAPDGERNAGFQIMRLKDKLGDRANASSEIEYDGSCYALHVGEREAGIKTILQMVQLTRLDCCIGASSSSRRALQVALNHTASRDAFGSKLLQQPLMQNLMAELCCETEAHTLCALRLAQAYGRAYSDPEGGCDDEEEKEFFRVGVAAMKYYSTKAQPQFVYECLESLGGNGFTEEWPLAKLFRHSPLNSIWEGSGNVMCLDVLRAKKSLPFLLKDLHKSRGMDSAMDRFMDSLDKSLLNLKAAGADDAQRQARNIVDRLAIAMQASVMMQHGHEQSARHFIACRIMGSESGCGGGRNYGAVSVASASQAAEIIGNNMPVFLEHSSKKIHNQ